MKHVLTRIVLCLSLLLVTSTVVRAGESGRDLAQDLEKQAKELRDEYKDYLKDIRHWEPRGSEADLYRIMEDLEDSADELGDNLKDGWGRRAAASYNDVTAVYQALERYIVLARDGKVQRRYRDVCDAMIRLSRRGPDRDYDRRGGSRAIISW